MEDWGVKILIFWEILPCSENEISSMDEMVVEHTNEHEHLGGGGVNLAQNRN